MIYIRENDNDRLVIESPQSVHKMQGIIFTVLGLIFTLAVAADRETSIFVATMPFLLFVTGIVFLSVGGKPDRLVIDKINRKVSILIHSGAFKKEDPVLLDFDDIKQTFLGSGSTSGTGNLASRSTQGIDFILNDGKKIQATIYVNRKKRAEEAYEAVRMAIGK